MHHIPDQIALRLGYLNILQGIINRLAGSASTMKAGNVAVMTALLACSLGERVQFHWALFIVPGALFMVFHAYFLQQERAFIALYNHAADQPLAETLGLRIDVARLSRMREPLWTVLCRPAVLAFHSVLVAACIVIVLAARGEC
ncbi:hypothetical protein ACTUVK_002887 [Stenotrophomonas rhizophila]